MEKFNLKAEILKEHSKAQRDKIVEWVGNDQKRFDKLFSLFLHDEYTITQRAAWPLGYCITAYPGFIKRNFGELVKNLSKPGIPAAVKRNTVRILQEVNIPEAYEGEVMTICFQYVESPTETVAVKAFSLTVLGILAKAYPEILPELKLLIEAQLPDQTAAFKSRAKQFLISTGKS